MWHDLWQDLRRDDSQSHHNSRFLLSGHALLKASLARYRADRDGIVTGLTYNAGPESCEGDIPSVVFGTSQQLVKPTKTPGRYSWVLRFFLLSQEF